MMKLKIFTVLAVSLPISACNPPKTVEGSIYYENIDITNNLNVRESNVRVSSATVHLVDAKIKSEIEQLLKEYDEKTAAAKSLAVNAEVAKYLEIIKVEETDAKDKQVKMTAEMDSLRNIMQAATEAEKNKSSSIQANIDQKFNQLNSLSADLKNAEAELKNEAHLVEALQAEKDRVYEEQKENLSALLDQKKRALQQIRSEASDASLRLSRELDQAATAAASEKKNAEEEIARSTKELNAERAQLASRISLNYNKEKISFIKTEKRGYSGVEQCFQIQNNSERPIISAEIDFFYRGKSLRGAGIGHQDFTMLIDGYIYITIAADFKDGIADKDGVARFITKNRYGEELRAIPPGGLWPQERVCLSLSEYAVRGDIQRTFEKLGGFDKNGSLNLALSAPTFANPSTLKAQPKYTYSNEKIWEYAKQPEVEVFSREVDSEIARMPNFQRLKSQNEKLASLEKTRGQALDSLKQAITQSKSEYTIKIKAAEDAEESAAVALRQVQREIIKTEKMIRLEAVFSELSQGIKKTDNELNLLRTEMDVLRSQTQMEFSKFKQAEAALERVNESLKEYAAISRSLRASEGVFFEAIVLKFEKARGRKSNEAVDQEWLKKLLHLLQSTKGTSVRTTWEGKFRFENIRQKSPFLYATATVRGAGFSEKSFLWLRQIDLDKTTLNDLGGGDSVSLADYDPNNFNAFRGRLIENIRDQK